MTERRARRWVEGIAGLIRAYWIAPIGIGMPGFILLLFLLVPQMPGMLVATSDGYVDAAAGLPLYHDAWWHQIGLPISLSVLSFQCWYWTRAALNAAVGQYDAERAELPTPEKWAGRLLLAATLLLGLAPVWTPLLSARNWSNLTGLQDTVPWWGVAMAVVCWSVLFRIIVKRRGRTRFQNAVRADRPSMPASLIKRLFAAAPWGALWARILLGAAVLGILIVQLSASLVEKHLHTLTGALLGASCYVAVGTVWLTLLRDGFRWALQRWTGLEAHKATSYGGVLGLALFAAWPFAGSYLAAWLSLYTVRVAPDDGRWRAAADKFQPPSDCRRPIIVAAAGGASRAAAWEMSVFHALDVATSGEFSRCLSAISGVSGGSLGAVTYGLARAQDKLGKDLAASDRFRDATVALARYDMLPAVAFNLLSADLLFGFPSRGPALSDAFENYWRYWSGLGIENLSFKDAARGPVLALNGVDVRTGARLITTNMIFSDGDRLANIVAGYDVLGRVLRTQRSGFSAADAVLNSARFPIMSPPGMMDGGGEQYWSVVDGGVYEASGVATALELAAMLHPNAEPILVIISNDGTPLERAPSSDGPCTPAADDSRAAKRNALDASGQLPVPELFTSLAGLYQTRGTRYLVELARARAQFCGAGEGRRRLFMFELPAPQERSGHTAVPMNWALGSRDCDFMLGAAIRWTPNLSNLRRMAEQLGKSPPADLEARFERNAALCRQMSRPG